MSEYEQEQENFHISGFAVEPITNCPHIPSYTLTTEGQHILFHTPCQACQDTRENWQCLHCKAVYCSRYIQGHMKRHVEHHEGHCVCISYRDLSIWCFQCDSYITHERLEPIKRSLYISKFGQEPPVASGSGSNSSSSRLRE